MRPSSNNTGSTHFSGAKFPGGTVNFAGAKFCGARVNFFLAKFSGARVDFADAETSGGTVNFGYAGFSGAEVDFLRSKFTGESPKVTGAGTSGGLVFSLVRSGSMAGGGKRKLAPAPGRCRGESALGYADLMPSAVGCNCGQVVHGEKL